MSTAVLRSSPPSGFDAQPLLHLLSATKPDTVDSLTLDAFRLRHSTLDPTTQHKWTTQLNKSDDEAQQVDPSLTPPPIPHPTSPSPLSLLSPLSCLCL